MAAVVLVEVGSAIAGKDHEYRFMGAVTGRWQPPLCLCAHEKTVSGQTRSSSVG